MSKDRYSEFDTEVTDIERAIKGFSKMLEGQEMSEIRREDVMQRVEEELEEYVKIKTEGREGVHVEIVAGIERSSLIVLFANTDAIPGTLFEAIWTEENMTLTITEYHKVSEEFIYIK